MLDGGPPWWLGQLGFHAPTAGSLGSIPGQGTKILHATWWAKPKKKKFRIDTGDQHQSETVAIDREGVPVTSGSFSLCL